MPSYGLPDPPANPIPGDGGLPIARDDDANTWMTQRICAPSEVEELGSAVAAECQACPKVSASAETMGAWESFRR